MRGRTSRRRPDEERPFGGGGRSTGSPRRAHENLTRTRMMTMGTRTTRIMISSGLLALGWGGHASAQRPPTLVEQEARTAARAAAGASELLAVEAGAAARAAVVASATTSARAAAIGPWLARVGAGLAGLDGSMEEGAGRAERASRRASVARPAMPPPPWIQEDPGSRMYQAARDLLSRGRFGPAAAAFAELRE